MAPGFLFQRLTWNRFQSSPAKIYGWAMWKNTSKNGIDQSSEPRDESKSSVASSQMKSPATEKMSLEDMSSRSSFRSSWPSQIEHTTGHQSSAATFDPRPNHGMAIAPSSSEPRHINGNPGKSTGEEDLLVNSSLMFFSTRPDAESLHLLANSSKLEPQALEILLRNWKPGGEYLRYLDFFIQNSTCCSSILVVNWTRWWGTDQTLFDLVDQIVPGDERIIVMKTLLRGDLHFQQEFTRLRAPWADAWRLACQQDKWEDARQHLMGLEVHNQLKDCTLCVIAEALLERRHRSIEAWRGGSSTSSANAYRPFPTEDRDEYLGTLKDCREMGLDVAHSWYEYGDMPWMR
jgi:hypothetical protein